MSSIEPGGEDRDPRPPPGEFGPATFETASATPAVAEPRSGAGLWVVIGGAALMGTAALAFMVSHRRPPSDLPTSAAAPAIQSPGEPPPELAMIEAEGRGTGLAPTAPPPLAPALQPVAPTVIVPTAGGAPGAALEAAQHRRAPALIVDLDPGAPAGGGGTGGGSNGQGAATPASASTGQKPAAPQLSGEEQFSQRIGAQEPDQATATRLSHPRTVVPQGTMIPAVLETAMNSDLPGFVRAVVSRDVRGFDGTAVLIPRGSRLVGQYRSGLSQGASRIFVIWTRVLRPDGVSVQIGSPGGDPLGRAGQEGKVHSHFFRQFADSILLSVIAAEITNLAAQPSTQIVIGGIAGGIPSSTTPPTIAPTPGVTPGATTGSTTQAPLFPPTITVQQGAPISIFVARDLDFFGYQGEAR